MFALIKQISLLETALCRYVDLPTGRPIGRPVGPTGQWQTSDPTYGPTSEKINIRPLISQMPASKPTDYINYRQFNVTPVLRLANGNLSSRMPHIVDRCISTNSQRTSPSESSGISLNTFEGTVHRFDTGGRGTVSS